MCITLTNREGLRGPDTQSNFSSSVLLSAKAHSLSVAAHCLSYKHSSSHTSFFPYLSGRSSALLLSSSVLHPAHS